MGAVGAAAAAWPFIDQMNPDASTRALASIEVDVSAIEEGQAITVKWRGKPVFIRNRTAKEIEEAKAVALDELKDPIAENANLEAGAPATDENRSAGEGKENWIVMIGSCTHLGCVPVGTSGRFRRLVLPVPRLALRYRRPYPQGTGAAATSTIPVFAFTSDTNIKIG